MKILCVGRNYINHAKELNNAIPSEPVIFIKPSSSIADISRTIPFPTFTKDLHYEVEFVIKICKKGTHILAADARSYYKEMTVGIDYTARDIQEKLKQKSLPWEIAKGFDNATVVGKFIPIDNKDPQLLNIKLSKNDVIVQDGNTSDMIFKINDLIQYISQYFTLEVGDLIFTGTPEGVGPVNSGDNLKGYLENECLFEMNFDK